MTCTVPNCPFCGNKPLPYMPGKSEPIYYHCAVDETCPIHRKIFLAAEWKRRPEPAPMPWNEEDQNPLDRGLPQL